MEKIQKWRRAAALAALLVVAACGGGDGDAGAGGGAGSSGVTVRLGYFPNITHAAAIVGVEGGLFARALAPDRLDVTTFNAGPAAVEALFSGALDATYIGPNPAINAFAKSKGEAIRIVAGATSGGAALVVKPEIEDAADLEGKKIATPQLGNTQDVALRHWLGEQRLATDVRGGGDVSIVPQENAQSLETFRSGAIHGAWVPEPWVTRLVQEGGGRVLVDERDLWPGGRFVTTHLVVRTEFLREHPDTVRRLLVGHVEATAALSDGAAARAAVVAGIGELTGKPLADEIAAAAWRNLEFTVDPLAASLRASAEHAEAVGLLEPVDLDGIYDVSLLNAVLRARGEEEVEAS